jgi:PDDEXK-like domain of unknown function (DUF3799)
VGPITSITQLPPGIYPDIPAEVYHRKELGVVSAGVLRRITEKTPAHYLSWVESEDEKDTPALVFGRAYHDRVLLPELFDAKYVGEPSGAPMRPTEAMRNAKSPSVSSIERVAFWDDWDAANEGKIVLSKSDFSLIETMHAALMIDPYIADLFADGESEVTLRWDDEETGLPCKARADRWKRRDRKMIDLKTTEDAGPRGFGRSVVNYGYDVTHAHYSEGARACGEPIDEYLIVAQEKSTPYLAVVYKLDAAGEARGYEIRKRGIDTMAECMSSGIWPGYPRGVQELSLPGWAITNEMEIGYVD